MSSIEDFYNPPAWSQGHISLDDAIFLDRMVREHEPQEIIEVGVASGCSSAVLLRSLALLGGPRKLHSFDIVNYCYFDPERPVGTAVEELAPQFMEYWSLYTAHRALDAGVQLKGRNIRLAFIDADHRHPWATLDLWALLPALAPDAWIVLHDITLARFSEWKVFGPEFLFESWPGEKTRASESSNIGAIRLAGNHRQARRWLTESLCNPWEIAVDKGLLDQLDIPLEVRPELICFQKLPESLRNRLLEFSGQGRDLILWGAGGTAPLCLAELLKEGIRPIAFVDRDEAKHGHYLQGIPIGPTHELTLHKSRPFVIVSSNEYASEIVFELNKLGFAQSKDFVCYNPWLSTPTDKIRAEEIHSNLLGMTTAEEQRYLFHYARDCYDGSGAIVDLGCWLGSTTIPLTMGLESASRDHIVHAYDLFEWHAWMDRYAGELKGRFAGGDSFLPEFEQRLGPLISRVSIHVGDLTKVGWSGGPIAFLLVDAMKSWELCSTIYRNFLPFVMDGKGLVMHQDFKFWGCPWIHLTMFRLRDCFEIERDLPNSPGTVFRLIHSPALDSLEDLLKEDDYSTDEVEEAYAYWSKTLSGPLLHQLDCARVLALGKIGARKEALAALESLLKGKYELGVVFLDELRPLFPDARLPLPDEPWRTSLARAMNASRLIWMWGAGPGGRGVLQRNPFLQNTLQGVIDSDPNKAGRFIKNVPIFGPEILVEHQSPPFVVVATSFVSEVTAHLRRLGYARGRDYCAADLQ